LALGGMTNTNFMEPPWLKFPKIPLGSIGWRMGAGEDYWYKWQDWYMTQSTEVQVAIRTSFAEPLGWEGFYARTVEHFASRLR
jgi:hypothetical protein